MEEDRERHKRLRERGWVVPKQPSSLAAAPGMMPSPADSATVSGSGPSPFTPASPGLPVKHELPGIISHDSGTDLDIEFDQAWDDGSDLDDEDFAAMRE